MLKYNKLNISALFEKYINISALEMASPGNRHCANCNDALSFPIMGKYDVIHKTGST